MPRFTPFAALRPTPGTDLAAVTAPPYDVLTRNEAHALWHRHPTNIIRVDVPTIDSAAPDPYAAAASRLRDWVESGALVRDSTPSFTIYRMRFTDDRGIDRDLAGVIGALEVVDEDAGGVLAHERTTPKATTDRLDLTRATFANLSPVWGLSLAGGLTDLLREPAEHVGSLTHEGVEHRIERVTDPARIAAIGAAVASDDVLIADGHHRYAVSRTFRDEVRASTGREDTEAESTMAYVGELVPDQLAIAAIHRLYAGVDPAVVRAALERDFEVTEAPIPSLALLSDMERLQRLVFIGPEGSASWLTPRPGAFDRVRALDGAWLEHTFEGTGIVAGYQHGVAEVLEAVVTGRARCAVLIRPPSIEEIARTAHERALMPPKSTFFTPKLSTGFVLREIDVPAQEG